MSEIDELIAKTRKLSIHQRQLVLNLIDELTTKQDQGRINNRERNTTDRESNRFTCSKGRSLKIGDRVLILNNRKTGKRGDTARITKFNKTLVALVLDKNGSYTQRDRNNIEYIEE